MLREFVVMEGDGSEMTGQERLLSWRGELEEWHSAELCNV